LQYGIALLEMGRWNEAEGALIKAIAMNPFDKDAKSLLRTLYLKTGRANEADLIGRVDFLRMVAVEYGQKTSDVEDVGVLDYADLSIRHRLAKGSTLTWSGGGLRQSVYWGDIRQSQGYLRYDQAFRGGWTFTSGLTLLDYNYTLDIDQAQEGDRALVGSMELAKRFSDLGVRAQFSASNLYESTHMQGGVKLDMYPGKWASWKVSVNPFFLDNEIETKRGIAASIHWYSVENTELAISAYSGDAYNTIEDAGYIVNNSLDLTRYRTGAYLQRNIFDHLPVFVMVQYERREERFFGFPYNSISWFAGLKYQL
jgi:tetratricopeptide (TPR) repeat protein